MKRLYLLGLVLYWAAPAHATHLLGGEIQARNISGLTYELTTVLYLDIQNGQASANAQTEVTLCLGDGRQVTAGLTGSEVVNGMPGVQRSSYQVVYTYAAPGLYTISSSFDKFAQNILNLSVASTSQEVAMVIQTSLNTNVANSTAQAPEPGFRAGLRQRYTLPLPASDPDGDSLAYRIVRILRSNADCGGSYPNSDYIFPNEVTREGTFKIDRPATTLTWNAPTRVGTYTYTYVTEEWRQGTKVAESWRANTLFVSDLNGAVDPVPPYEPVQLYESGLVTGNPAQEYLPAHLNLQVYPIPSENWIRIQVDSRQPAPLVIELMDTQGKVLQKTDIVQLVSRHTQEINVQHLARGIYFIRVRSTSGVLTRKVLR